MLSQVSIYYPHHRPRRQIRENTDDAERWQTKWPRCSTLLDLSDKNLIPRVHMRRCNDAIRFSAGKSAIVDVTYQYRLLHLSEFISVIVTSSALLLQPWHVLDLSVLAAFSIIIQQILWEIRQTVPSLSWSVILNYRQIKLDIWYNELFKIMILVFFLRSISRDRNIDLWFSCKWKSVNTAFRWRIKRA